MVSFLVCFGKNVRLGAMNMYFGTLFMTKASLGKVLLR